jgi:hypothetical protein
MSSLRTVGKWDTDAIDAQRCRLDAPALRPGNLLLPHSSCTIYKSYPVYAAGREPTGYFERLKQQDPEVTWDSDRRQPSLDTDAK